MHRSERVRVPRPDDRPCSRPLALLLVLAAALAALLPLAGTARAAGDQWPPPGVTEAYAREVGVSPAEATRQLDLQRRARPIGAQLQATLGEAYAGLAFDDRGTGRLIVPLATGSTARTTVLTARIRSATTAAGLTVDELATPQVEHSMDELEAALDDLYARLRPQIAAGTVGVALDVERNRVVVQLDPTAAADDRDGARAAASAAGSIAIVAEQAAGRATPTGCGTFTTTMATSHAYCAAPLRGGVKLVGPATGAQCTVGGFATNYAQTRHYAITAGHCLTGTLGTAWYSRDWPAESRRDVGSASALRIDGWGDFGLIDMTGSPWLATPSPLDTPQSAMWGIDDAWRTLSTGIVQSQPVVGELLCWSGGSSVGCVIVRTLATTYLYPTGETPILADADVVATYATACVLSGSSGAPLMDGHTLVGIVDGNAGCGTAVFTPIAKVAFSGGVNIAYG